MKKYVHFILASAMLFGMWACENKEKKNEPVVDDIVLTLTPSNIAMTVGLSKQLTLNVSGTDDYEITKWSSEDEDVATVDQKGLVKSVGLGSTRIRCDVNVDGDDYRVYCPIEVEPDRVIFKEKTAAIFTKATVQLGVTLLSETTPKVTYKSLNTSMATVSASGLVTAGNYSGECMIVASQTNAVSDTCVVTINKDRIILSKDTIYLSPSASSQLSAKLVSGRSGTYNYTSTSSSIATVDSKGMVKAGTTTGTCKVIASNEYSISDTCIVKVGNYLVITPSNILLGVGEQITVSANQTGVTWKVANTSIARISGTTLSGVAPGKTTLTATNGSLTATVDVEVVQYVTSLSHKLGNNPMVVLGSSTKSKSLNIASSLLNVSPASALNSIEVSAVWTYGTGSGNSIPLSYNPANTSAPYTLTLPQITGITVKRFRITWTGIKKGGEKITCESPEISYVNEELFDEVHTYYGTIGMTNQASDVSTSGVATISYGSSHNAFSLVHSNAYTKACYNQIVSAGYNSRVTYNASVNYSFPVFTGSSTINTTKTAHPVFVNSFAEWKVDVQYYKSGTKTAIVGKSITAAPNATELPIDIEASVIPAGATSVTIVVYRYYYNGTSSSKTTSTFQRVEAASLSELNGKSATFQSGSFSQTVKLKLNIK